MSPLRRLAEKRLPVALALGLLVLVAVLAGKTTGLLQPLDLKAYDQLLRLTARAGDNKSPVVVIGVTEADIRQLKQWPLTDEQLARTLEKLDSYEPAVIGIDIYRDIPVPPGSDALQALLATNPRLIGILKFQEHDRQGIPAHPALMAQDRAGFNDVVIDTDGIVRRGLLFLDDGVDYSTAFGLKLAAQYLARHGVALAPDPLDPEVIRLGQVSIYPLDPDFGGYYGEDMAGYQFMLRYHAVQRPFAVFSLSELINDSIPRDALSGKVVMLGVTAVSVKDAFHTPYNHGLWPDGEITGTTLHAHIANQLIDAALAGSRPVAALPGYIELMLAAVLAFAGAFAAWPMRSIRYAVVVLAAGWAIIAGLWIGLYQLNWWLPAAEAALVWTLSTVIMTFYIAGLRRKQQAMLRQLFSKHVSPEVEDAVWNQRDQLLEGGHLRARQLTVTVLFVDLVGFTTVSEQLPPEKVMIWLNAYLGNIAEIVMRFKGIVDDYLGDAVKADFGVPVGSTSDAEIRADALNAVRCAREICETIAMLNIQWQKRDYPRVTARIGINTGLVVAGSLGSASRMKYTTIGDAVNTASRLESYDKTGLVQAQSRHGTRILIGATTAMLVGDEIPVEAITTVTLKGKTEPTTIYRLIPQDNGSKDKSQEVSC